MTISPFGTVHPLLPHSLDLAVDETLIRLALRLEGTPSAEYLHDRLLEAVRSDRDDRVPLAVLYSVAATGYLRELAEWLDIVTHVQGQFESRTAQFHEDTPCVEDHDGHCTTCRGILSDRLWDALNHLKVLIGARALGDLREAVKQPTEAERDRERAEELVAALAGQLRVAS